MRCLTFYPGGGVNFLCYLSCLTWTSGISKGGEKWSNSGDTGTLQKELIVFSDKLDMRYVRKKRKDNSSGLGLSK